MDITVVIGGFVFGIFLGWFLRKLVFRTVVVGCLKIDTRNDEFDNYLLEVNDNIDKLGNYKYVTFAVRKVE